MAAPSITQAPRPLTTEQADVLAQRQVKKHDVAIMLIHWFNAIVWVLELATGVAMLTSSFRVAPWWYIQIVSGFFHSRANMLTFHIALGITWTAVFCAYGVFGFRTYLTKEVIKRETTLDRDDINWLRIRALGLLGRSKEPLPPQGIYNAGQKLFAVVVYATVPVVMITGLIMTFHLAGTAAVGWAAAIHFAAVGLVLSGLMIHVYMGAIFPEEKPAFFSMITGSVNELYAYTHHFKWWKEVSRVGPAILRESQSHLPTTPFRAPKHEGDK
jgi:formate dehydrogenase subunit gamma